MTAFRLKGVGSVIELSIEELFGYPNEISYGGGYGAAGILTIVSGSCSVMGRHSFTTGELYKFYGQLQKCYETLSGIAVLENTERELELRCAFDNRGGVAVSGMFQENPAVENILRFEFNSDQTYAVETLSLLKEVYRVFGDYKGITPF